MKASKALKHLFIPHEHNDYKPHFFREASIAILIALVMFLLGVSAGASFFVHRTVLGATMSTSVLIDLTNESRLANNEPPLIRSDLLDRAADLKAEDMVQEGYFAHTSPEGVTPWHWFQQVGYAFLYAGENLAVNFTDPTDVRDAWLASPKHRENLLDVRFKEIGMAAVSGNYEGDDSIFVVQLFGTPLSPAQPRQAERPVELAAATSSSQDEIVLESSEPQIKGAATGTPVTESDIPTYSSWYERLVFGSSYYVQMFYMLLFFIVLVALIVMVVIEVRKQHWKHITYGLSVLLTIVLAALINQAFF